MSSVRVGPLARRRTIGAVFLAVVLVASANVLHAQASIAGAVDDSLAGGPLVGALVELVSAADPSTNRRAIETDESGHFRIDQVAPGRYLIGFVHPRLDDLDIEVHLPPLVVRSRDTLLTVNLALPAGPTVEAAVCGSPADPAHNGLLRGRVLSADTSELAAPAHVRVRWQELLVSRRDGAVWRDRSLSADADEAGRFLVCGVPTGVELRVEADAGDARSGALDLLVTRATDVLERDLYVASPVALPVASPVGTPLAPSANIVARGGSASDSAMSSGPPPIAKRASLTGRVRRDDGGQLASAEASLRVPGMPNAVSIVGSDGTFSLDDLPGGTHMLEVRAIGFRPKRVPVDLVLGRTTSVHVVLDNRVPVLDTLRVRARESQRDYTGFTERSRGAFGHFMDETRIKSMHVTTVGDLLRTMPGVQVVPRVQEHGNAILMRGVFLNGAPCLPDVFVDGVFLVEGAVDLDNYVLPYEVVGMEVYTDMATVPVEYHRGSCGAVVVWTRHGNQSDAKQK